MEGTSERKRLQGVVKSDKMDKTVTVTVERLVQHPLYKKYIRRNSTLMAHDPHNDAHEGDLVEVESTRPLSRRKRWRLVRILRRAPGFRVEPSALGGGEADLMS
ncbi:MAG: 30S ribosomal protein S17 [Candidatus Brocadiia bacterium]